MRKTLNLLYFLIFITKVSMMLHTLVSLLWLWRRNRPWKNRNPIRYVNILSDVLIYFTLSGQIHFYIVPKNLWRKLMTSISGNADTHKLMSYYDTNIENWSWRKFADHFRCPLFLGLKINHFRNHTLNWYHFKAIRSFEQFVLHQYPWNRTPAPLW